MFPEVTRNDIFRLETRRLWMRWPRAPDAEAITRYASDPDVALMTAVIPHPYALADAEAFIRRVRASNEAGGSLHVALTPKGLPMEVIGAISLEPSKTDRGIGVLGFVLRRDYWNQGYMTEAGAAFVDFVFAITTLREIESSARPDNPASLRVMAKLGFVDAGEKMLEAPARGGPFKVKTMSLKRGAARGVFAARRLRPAPA